MKFFSEDQVRAYINYVNEFHKQEEVAPCNYNPPSLEPIDLKDALKSAMREMDYEKQAKRAMIGPS